MEEYDDLYDENFYAGAEIYDIEPQITDEMPITSDINDEPSDVIGDLIDAITGNNVELMQSTIRRVPITADKIEDILDQLLIYAVVIGSVDAFRSLLMFYEEYIKTVDHISLTPRIKYVFKSHAHTISILAEYGINGTQLHKFLFNVIDDLNITIITKDLCGMKDDTSTAAMMMRVLHHYNIMTDPKADEILRDLNDIAVDFDNLSIQHTIRQYRRQMAVQLNIYAQPASWIITAIPEPELITRIEPPLMKIEDIKRHYYTTLADKSGSAEDYTTPYDLDDESLTTLVTENREQFSYDIYIRNLSNTDIGRELDRMLGPVHTSTRNTHDELHVCRRYGGCRMLLCNCVEGNTEESDYIEDVDWFTGQCDECGQLIKNRRHALRLARQAGGWSGCYCSFPCLYTRMYSDSLDKEIIQQVESEITSGMIYNHINADAAIEDMGAYAETVLIKVDGKSS